MRQADLNLFVENTRSRLHAAIGQVVDKDKIEEIAQEAYIAVFVKMRQTKLENPIGYLLTTAKNLALSELRRQKAGASALSHVAQLHHRTAIINSESELIEQQQNALLLAAIGKLPPICRQVFIYRKIDEKSHAEIAEIMQISTKTVENHLAKGIRLCRKIMLESKAQANLDMQKSRDVG